MAGCETSVLSFTSLDVILMESHMNILAMLEELRSEQQHLEEAILVMERLAAGAGVRRRGRPPKWLAATKTTDGEGEPKKRRVFSAATRKKMAAAQKKRWAAKKAA
jgi:hypothetical protein